MQFTGSLVDWLAHGDRAAFLASYWAPLLAMAVVVAIVFPLLGLGGSLLQFQTTFGAYPMLVRWKAHRFMLGQSLAFFNDEFAGRVSQKVMQTALAVRDSITRILDVGVYIVVYFIGTLWLLGQSDVWLVATLVVWLAAYVALLAWFVPRLGAVGELQADARAEMTGRVVDSYTNIQTVKLFAHTTREHDYARSAMSSFLGTVNQQARMFTSLSLLLNVLNSVVLVAGRGDRHLRVDALADERRRDHRGARPRHAAAHHVAVDHVGGRPALREHRHGARRHHHAVAADHREGPAGRRGAGRAQRRDSLRSRPLPLRARRRQGPRRLQPDHPPGREGRAGRPLGRRQVDASSTCSCASTTWKAGAS